MMTISNIGSVVLRALLASTLSITASAEDLIVGKSCPVNYRSNTIGHLVISKPWYHASRTAAAYIPMDNATGIGVEIHFFANEAGDTRYGNIAHCDRYRLLQVRSTNARLLQGEDPTQLDIPSFFNQPFYDKEPLEYGYGTHQTPMDDIDKPWRGRPSRSSTVAIYDTPYVSDHYGTDGENINVRFETCAVCERDNSYDNLLSCVTWGYEREYMGGQTGWAEPETLPMQCVAEPTPSLRATVNKTANVTYNYGQHWR
ncbi:MAG: hypothetical protein MI976_27155 [Pseudomonadales bacterium]|nr:hypothetical protein [Pseudomonadales bacterium]